MGDDGSGVVMIWQGVDVVMSDDRWSRGVMMMGQGG